MASVSPNDVVRDVSLEREWKRLRDRITRWVENSDPDMRPMLRRQFEGSSKYFRPLTVFACHCCDDVADVLALKRLGGGGEEDLREGILTLPASLAILPRAARELDELQRQVVSEARYLNVLNHGQMLKLIADVRLLAPTDEELVA